MGSWACSYLFIVLSRPFISSLPTPLQVLFPELGLDLVEMEEEGEHSLALSLSSWQV